MKYEVTIPPGTKNVSLSVIVHADWTQKLTVVFAGKTYHDERSSHDKAEFTLGKPDTFLIGKNEIEVTCLHRKPEEKNFVENMYEEKNPEPGADQQGDYYLIRSYDQPTSLPHDHINCGVRIRYSN